MKKFFIRFQLFSIIVTACSFTGLDFNETPTVTASSNLIGEASDYAVFFPLLTSPSEDSTEAAISNLMVITPSVAPYEKFEVQFDLETQASNLDLPYDDSPPLGLYPEIGVTVDALFTPDSWHTIFTQPAFIYQPYEHSIYNGKDHFSPSGSSRWAVRFAPQQAGNWFYRLRVEDSQGIRYFPSPDQPGLEMTVVGESQNLYTRRGFLEVSQADPRYFGFQDGTPFIGVGFNGGFSASPSVEGSMVLYEQSKINFIRVWLSGAGINGSQWTSWASHHVPNDNYLPGVNFDWTKTYNDSSVSLKLDSSAPCIFSDFWQGGIPVDPNTTYQLWARVKVDSITGPVSAGDYGFVIKQGGWLGTDCVLPNNGVAITSPLTGSSDWTTVSGTYKTGSTQHWLNYLYLTRQNATGGQAYIDEIRLWRADDPYQTNILREPYADSIQHFDPMNAAQWDLFLELAERHGVYLKLVIDEKNEWIRNHMDENGAITTSGNNNNFYASPGTKVRWLQEAWWRYIIARWGYSTAIHSFEYINEGDPYNGNHYEAANAMAEYFHSVGSSKYLVTTSFWAAFPNIEFWSNPEFHEIDYADIHAYISTGWGQTATFLSESKLDMQPEHIYEGDASAKIIATNNWSESIVPRGLVIKGEGEWIVRYWMKAENFSANCAYNSTGSMQRIRWILDGGTYWGGTEGVVPNNDQGKDFICTSPAGSFDWTEFRSDRDRDGNLLPQEWRIIVTDELPHEISIQIENYNGTGGTAWIDNVELISPWNEVVKTIGKFDITHMDEDTAFYNLAYGQLWGGGFPAGAHVPLVRGETGVDYPGQQDWNRDLLLDTDGIWLHNNLWGQVNPGGMYELFWWASETIHPEIYDNYLTYQNFMDDIPLNNGNYHDANAITTHPDLRAWGQYDDVNGRLHLWVQNTQHTWVRVVHGPAIPEISGQIIVNGVQPGDYTVEWWDTYEVTQPVILTQTITSNGSLTLTLPAPLLTDIGVKIQRLP